MGDNGDETWSSSSDATPPFRYFWDVFLSFRGEDTRHGFTSHLYDELSRNGVRTFLDDKGLERGAEISPTLVAAIKDSAAAVAVISKNYATSKWCLEELATILLDSNKLMLPVFYEVDPSDVRRQKGPFESAFNDIEVVEQASREKVARWRLAMKKAGETAGWDSRHWEESDLIQALVKNILTKLSNTPLDVVKYPVGLNSRVDKLLSKFDVKANGVRVFGLYGMGGIGKTALCKALYNKLIVHFKKRCFISNVRENFQQPDGLLSLQSKLIGDLNSSAPPAIDDVSKGIIYIKESIQIEPVFLVLDDVDDAKQVHELIGGRGGFFEGSRIIVTSRDKNVLLEISMDEVFEVEKLPSFESLQLFSYHAFGREEPTEKFRDLSEQVVTLTNGLPLALEVFGASMFFRRTMKEWRDALQKLKRIRPGNVQDVLEISFKGLDEEEQCIFLDIACFFSRGNLKREDAIDIFKGCGFNAETALTDLVSKSLVKIIDDDVLSMHDQIRDMGCQIVRNEDYADAGKRSRLWDHSEIMTVLKNYKGTRSIQGITIELEKKQAVISEKLLSKNSKQNRYLASFSASLKQIYRKCISSDLKKDDGLLSTKAFQPMISLRLLQINHMNFTGSFNQVSAELKWLQWKGCPLRVLPSDFIPRDLAVLDLSESKITRFSGCSEIKMAKRLRVMNLRDCYDLEDIPDLSGLQLEKLILERCYGLVKIHKSIGDMNTLNYLNLNDCRNLLEFPDDVSGLKCLEKLVLSGCSNLRKLPEHMSGLKSLRELFVNGTAIEKLPNSIFRLKSLEVFNLNNCQLLKLLPDAIGNLSSLRELSLDASGLQELPQCVGKLANLEILSLRMCRSLKSIPDSIGNLKSLIKLFVNNSSIENLPDSIGSLSRLRWLCCGGCRSLEQLPASIGGLSSLVLLQLERTPLKQVPDEVSALKSLEKLEFGSCELLRSLPKLLGNMLSLTSLVLDFLPIVELPESIGSLERLDTLRLNNCVNLKKLPTSIGKLRSLRSLSMVETSVTVLPDEFGTLSSLKVLKLRKNQQSENHQGSAEEKSMAIGLPESFSNLSLLEDLDAHSWYITGKFSNDFEKLSSLQNLNLGHNNFHSLPLSLKGLSVLKKLSLPHCKELKFLPPLPSSLIELNVADCTKLECISDLSDLKSLQELQITNCRMITEIPGLEHLNSLKRIFTGGCNACLPDVKRRLSKATLKYLRNLCIPGSKIPSWFVRGIPKFSRPKNCELKGVIIGIVASLDQQVKDSFRNKVPAIVDIQAKIIRRNDPIYTTTLYLLGVPDSNEDQLYICRFHNHNQLVFMLEEGDALQVAMRETPRFKGLKLKQHGIFLVFENDDDFDDNDDALCDEPQQSVSKRLATFFTSL